MVLVEFFCCIWYNVHCSSPFVVLSSFNLQALAIGCWGIFYTYREKIYELAEVFGATGNVQIVFGDDVKEIIDEYDLDGLDADEIFDLVDCSQVELEGDELFVSIEDDDVFLAVFGDKYDSFYNVKEHIDPVYIWNAVNSDSVSYEEVKETIEKIKNLIK